MKHKIGDVVTIRSWESMAAEFGTHVINCRDVINVPAFFIPEMRMACGESCVITKVCPEYGWYILEGLEEYVFSDEMFTTWRL